MTTKMLSNQIPFIVIRASSSVSVRRNSRAVRLIHLRMTFSEQKPNRKMLVLQPSTLFTRCFCLINAVLREVRGRRTSRKWHRDGLQGNDSIYYMRVYSMRSKGTYPNKKSEENQIHKKSVGNQKHNTQWQMKTSMHAHHNAVSPT